MYKNRKEFYSTALDSPLSFVGTKKKKKTREKKVTVNPIIKISVFKKQKAKKNEHIYS